MADKKELIIVGGANGTGKTTFANEYVAQHPITYLSADAIAFGIDAKNPTSARFQAGRQFVTLLEQMIGGNESLLVETTLSGVSLRKAIKRATRAGFIVSIYYLFVDSAETCIKRVAQRVRAGGHHVPEEDIRRRFGRSIQNFWNVYREMAESLVVIYNSPEQLMEVARGSNKDIILEKSNHFGLFRSLCDSDR